MTETRSSDAAEGEVSALARGLTVLRYAASAPAPVTLKEISEGTGIPKPTASRLVTTLLGAGLMRKAPNSDRFELGPGVMAFATAFLDRMDFRALARPHMHRFAEQVGVSMHLGVRDRLEMVLIETARPMSAAIVMRIGIGGRLGLASSALGRAYMAALDSTSRQTLIGGLQVAGGNRWPDDAAGLDPAIAHFNQHGYTISLGEWHPDINAIAVPIVMPNGDIYAMNCGGPAFKLPEAFLRNTVAPGLIACVETIAAESGASMRAPDAPAESDSSLRRH
ncbi:IclR family transcriptional regulator [Cupriavidus sp. 8B]